MVSTINANYSLVRKNSIHHHIKHYRYPAQLMARPNVFGNKRITTFVVSYKYEKGFFAFRHLISNT